MQLELIKLFTSAPCYFKNELPATIGNAIYTFGSNEIREIEAFIDLSDTKDGSKGLIITPTHLYDTDHCIAFEEITSLRIDTTKTKAYVNGILFSEYQAEPFLEFLSDLSEVTILLEGPTANKIAYDLDLIVNDLLDEVYEDIELTASQKEKIENLKEELDHLSTLSEADYAYECEDLLVKHYPLFEELGLDSDEMDELDEILKKIQEKQDQMNKQFEQATNYYQNMYENLKKGDPTMFNQMKSILKMIGITEEDLQNKSPEELDAMVDSLCQRFGVSRSQVEAFAKKFQK